MSTPPAFSLACPRCRTTIVEPGRFCPSCGAALAEASTHDASAPTPGGPAGAAHASAPREDRRVSASNQAWLGKVVDGRYRVLDVIGRGGMGVVYRVEHVRMGKLAAMKVLHRDLADDPEIVARFEREAAAVSKLHHPHTVQVFDFGSASGALYLVMEYVRGVDLARMIERDGPMPWARAAPVLVQICSALHEAHELGIVHRDLKPENVLVTRTAGGRDYAKVLDFGLAKLEQRQPSPMTDKQAIVGTPYFMSPEQIRGDEVDQRSDLYSFGALMFEVLTGQHLFEGSTSLGVLTKHLTSDPDAPSTRAPRLGIDPRVDQLCLKALAKEPAARWQSASELLQAIEEVYAETVDLHTGAGRVPTASRAQDKPRTLRLAPEDHEHLSDQRLRRSDLDVFERSLRRRRSLTRAALLTVAAAALAASGWFVLRERPPLVAEREPNDAPGQANPIAAGRDVTGYLGKRRSPQDGDRDVYVVAGPAGKRRLLTVRVSGLPNADIELTLSSRDGSQVVRSDENRIGEGEVLHRRSVEGTVVVTVGQRLDAGQRPVENVSDPYTLRVTEEALAGELEPNASDADATPVEPSRALHGFLDARDDVDLLRWTGPEGAYQVTVRADDLPLTWRLGDGAPRLPGTAAMRLERGALIRLERTDRAAAGNLPAREATWSVLVTP